MTEPVFFDEITKTVPSREQRDRLSLIVLQNEALYCYLFQLILNKNPKYSPKAAWVLEQVSLKKPAWLYKHARLYFDTLPQVNNQRVIRSLAKLASVFTKDYKNSSGNSIADNDVELLIRTAFEWLLDDTLKVAPKVHAMQTLYHLRTYNQWIPQELFHILDQNYQSGSAGYKARARKLMNALKKQ